MRLVVGLIVTKVRREPEEVDRRLAELGLTRNGLLKVRAVAITEARNATPNHCANAPGTFAYQHGSWALRHEFVGAGRDWVLERPNNVEAIWNEALKVRVVFSNVDIACQDDPGQEPKPRSDKGAGSERVCQGNLFGDLPRYAPKQYSGEATFYLMVDANAAAELTRPVISGGTFSAYIERNYLSDGSDFASEMPNFNTDDTIDDFDPKVARR